MFGVVSRGRGHEKACFSMRSPGAPLIVRSHFLAAYGIRLLHASMAHVKQQIYNFNWTSVPVREIGGANGEIQKEQEQSEAQPDGA
jgi:hypothetical protein